jgi:uncharacterized protein YgbK (DUF1537 family)
VIAQSGLQIRQELIFVGSAGLTHQIAVLSEREHDVPDKSKIGKRLRLPYKPILIVIGSKSPVSRAQCEQVTDQGEVDVLRAKISALESGDGTIVGAVTRALVNRRDLVITTELPEPINEATAGLHSPPKPDEGGSEAPSKGARGFGLASEARSTTASEAYSTSGEGLMRNLGSILGPFLDQFSGVILTGGETARGVLTQSGIGRLSMLDEIAPGVTLSESLSKPQIPIIMKAGAFGSPATLLNALHFLRSHKR